MKYLLLFLMAIIGVSVSANDGAFRGKGNQLIPINETDIRVKKEILTLKKINNKYIAVTVYYEFFNPKTEKNLTVGFEAFAPEGDVDGAPKNGKHPYMRNFSVVLNDKVLKYNVAYVRDTLYNQKGKIKAIDLNKFQGNTSGNNIDFFYVYHFNATFKKGLNIIKHTYIYDVSGSIDYNYDFEYALKPAMRWANKQIDDFTLIIDNGPFETFSIDKTFFKTSNEWQIKGIGKTTNVKGHKNSFIEKDALKFHIQNGNIIFHQTNFKPKGDLFLYAQNHIGYEDFSYIPFSYFQEDRIKEPQNNFQKRVLQNLPFARRGYVFKDKDLKQFFEKMDWYIPNQKYIADPKNLF